MIIVRAIINYSVHKIYYAPFFLNIFYYLAHLIPWMAVGSTGSPICAKSQVNDALVMVMAISRIQKEMGRCSPCTTPLPG